MTATLRALDGGSVEVGEEELGALQLQIRGAVLGAGDPGYAELRPPFNAMHQAMAGLVIACSGTADVVDAVNFARRNGLAVAVRGGGHSIAGLSTTDGGLLIDLGPMRGVQVDPERRLAYVQGGALWGDFDREAQTFGLATPGGVISDTGVGGLTLGGGYGWLRRRFGLSCDNVVEAQVVCADGEVRTASADSNPDLYWALRGGGGNFGVVTSFTFRVHAHGPIVAFAGVMYDAAELPSVVRGWRDYCLGAPREVTAVTVSFTFPADPHLPPVVHDRALCVVGGMYVGDVAEGMATLQPLRELGTPLLDISQPMPYVAVQSAFDQLVPRNTLRSYWKSQYVTELSDEAVDTYAHAAATRPAPLTIVNLWHMGGAISDVGPEETAFAERSSPFMVSIDGNWDDAARDAEVKAWVRSTAADFGRFGPGSGYLNFTGLDEEDARTGVDSAFGRNLARLADVKRTYDPGNLFRRTNNILPSR